MKVQQVNNQTSFGMEYSIPKSRAAIKKALVSNTKLVNNIDRKYKNAKASYISSENFETEDYYTIFLIHLTPQKIYRWVFNSHDKDFPDAQLCKHLQTLSIEEVEREAKETHEPLAQISIKKVNPFMVFLQNICDKIPRIIGK